MASTMNMQKLKFFPFMRKDDSVFDINTRVGGDAHGYSFWLETVTLEPRRDYKFTRSPRSLAISLRPFRPPGSPPRSLSQLSQHEPPLTGMLPVPRREGLHLPVPLPQLGSRQHSRGFGQTGSGHRVIPVPLKVPPRRDHDRCAQTLPNLHGRQERGVGHTGRWIPVGGIDPGMTLPRLTKSWS